MISNCVSIVIHIIPIAPVINIFLPNPSYTGIISLFWNIPTGVICYYLFCDSNPITSVTGLNYIANESSNSFINTIGIVGTYYYAVIALSPYGNSSLSNCVNVNISIPIAPLFNIIFPNPTYSESINLSWTNLGSVVNYYLFRDSKWRCNKCGQINRWARRCCCSKYCIG